MMRLTMPCLYTSLRVVVVEEDTATESIFGGVAQWQRCVCSFMYTGITFERDIMRILVTQNLKNVTFSADKKKQHLAVRN